MWADTDGDGIQDADEDGLPDVTVKLYLAGGAVVEAVWNLADLVAPEGAALGENRRIES